MKHLDLQLKEFGQQFTDQVKCLEYKVGVDNNILSSLLELYKRRAAIEQVYAESLLKLTSGIAQKTNLDNQKRPKWKNYSPINVLNSLLVSTERTALAHRNLGNIYGKQMTQRVIDMLDDSSRLTKRSIEILQHRHLLILNSLNKLTTKQKNYAKLFLEAEELRRKADKVLLLLDREVTRCHEKKKEMEKNFKIKKLHADYMEKFKAFQDRYNECTAARNKYIIHFSSLKDSLNHFYSNELHNIIQCTQYGFHNNLTRLTMNHSSCEEALSTIQNSISNLFSNTVDQIDTTNDTEVLYESHKSFLPQKEHLRCILAKDDTIDTVIGIEEKVENDLKNMYVKLDAKYTSISELMTNKRARISEISKSYNELINQKDYDVLDYVCQKSIPNQTSKDRLNSDSRDTMSDNLYLSIQGKVKEPKLEKEISYFKLMEEYLDDEIQFVNITNKLRNVENALNAPLEFADTYYSRHSNIHKQTAVMVGLKSKLFGGNLKRYCCESHETVPLVVISCIRLINMHGMHNIGVFRVPGSQYDVQLYKSQFEQGTDPLRVLLGDTNDVNLAASLLKMYFRELNPPIFDEIMFAKIVDKYNSVKHSDTDIMEFMKKIVLELHPAVYATLTYLISFLSHLSEFCSLNCMDILNLAIIFGPCLMPIPSDKSSQLFHYQAIVNHVTQCLITHHEQIFTNESNGIIYLKDQSLVPTSKSPTSTTSGSIDSQNIQFLDDSSIADVDEDKKRSRNQSSLSSVSLNTRSDDGSITAFDDFASIKDDGDIVSISSTKNIFVPIKCSSISEVIQDTVPEHQASETEADKQSSWNRKESIASSAGSLSVFYTQEVDRKMSLVSMDSELDLEMYPQRDSLVIPAIEIPTEFADNVEEMSAARVESIYYIDDADHSMIENISFERDSDVNTETTSSVLIRNMSQPIGLVDMVGSPTTLEDNLSQARSGLQHLEEMNVIKCRNTIQIDPDRLESKFFNPIWSDLSKEQKQFTDSQTLSDTAQPNPAHPFLSLLATVNECDRPGSVARSNSLRVAAHKNKIASSAHKDTAPAVPRRLYQNNQ